MVDVQRLIHSDFVVAANGKTSVFLGDGDNECGPVTVSDLLNDPSSF